MLRYLVFDLGMDYDSYYEYAQMKPIHSLAFQGKIAMIQVLLERSPKPSQEINSVCFWGGRALDDRNTPLFFAVMRDQAETVEFLLKRNGIVRHCSLTSLACEYGSIEVVKKLLDLGYSFDRETLSFRSPLDEICMNGDDQLLDLLKPHIKNRNHIDGYPNSKFPPPLYHLCFRGKTDMANVLISEMGADVKFVNQKGKTYLHTASKRGHKEIAELLLSHGVDLNRENQKGLTALDLATRMGHTEVERLLLHVGGIHGKGVKQTNPALKVEPVVKESQVWHLSTAVQDGNLEEVKQILSNESLESKWSSDAELELVKTCCKKGYLDILRVLHNQGMDIRGTVDPYRDSPLHFAAKAGNIEMIEFLIEKGAPINVPSDFKRSPISPLLKSGYTEALHFAADHQHLQAMEVLLKAGADPNAIDACNTTAMDRAVGFKNKRMIALLIEYGFNTGSRDRDDMTYMSLIANQF